MPIDCSFPSLPNFPVTLLATILGRNDDEGRSNVMSQPMPGIDLANLSAPKAGILVALFITLRKVARSRDFYSRVLGGTVVMDENLAS
jgi:hypothetical protein